MVPIAANETLNDVAAPREPQSLTSIESSFHLSGENSVFLCVTVVPCGAPERQHAVGARGAARVINRHVKDFAFSRRDGWVGFTVAGAPLGAGLLDYDGTAAAIRPRERGINQIIEHWLPCRTARSKP